MELNTISTATKMSKIIIPNAGNMWNNLELSCIAGGSVKWYCLFEKRFGNFF